MSEPDGGRRPCPALVFGPACLPGRCPQMASRWDLTRALLGEAAVCVAIGATVGFLGSRLPAPGVRRLSRPPCPGAHRPPAAYEQGYWAVGTAGTGLSAPLPLGSKPAPPSRVPWASPGVLVGRQLPRLEHKPSWLPLTGRP